MSRTARRFIALTTIALATTLGLVGASSANLVTGGTSVVRQAGGTIVPPTPLIVKRTLG